jgi:putative sugar O-methyltransferase
MPSYPELAAAQRDLKAQDALFHPTSFWEQASQRIAAELQTEGVENFRRLPTPLSYFVPTYGPPTLGLSREQVERLSEVLGEEYPTSKKAQLALDAYLSGHLNALADYRVMLAADDSSRLPYLHTFSESTSGNPVEQFEFNGRRFSRSSLNYLLGLSLLKKYLGSDEVRTVLEIGGGFGTLGEILAQSGIPDIRYIDIDIPPTHFVAERYLADVLGKERVATYVDMAHRDEINIDSLPTASVFCSWQIERLQGQVDLFVNFISFQEMEPPVVENYLSNVKRLGARWILLRNMREGKQKKTADSTGVEVPIKREDYLAMLTEYELVEVAVHPFGYETVDGFNSELMLLKHRKHSCQSSQ